jgi:hypothetical protein
MFTSIFAHIDDYTQIEATIRSTAALMVGIIVYGNVWTTWRRFFAIRRMAQQRTRQMRLLQDAAKSAGIPVPPIDSAALNGALVVEQQTQMRQWLAEDTSIGSASVASTPSLWRSSWTVSIVWVVIRLVLSISIMWSLLRRRFG